ncbi:hypothetical protein EV421DRAFT_1132044 [Armillaria borealis]|uniref:Uncharacterized protein n=1 Tax=Armillaria borealis TaxID=47425 RepID=A0AA39J4Z5_9AGAR|nr:hypothetical protein EV421DRAFT_1132044 [Armillaria borealis]
MLARNSRLKIADVVEVSGVPYIENVSSVAVLVLLVESRGRIKRMYRSSVRESQTRFLSSTVSFLCKGNGELCIVWIFVEKWKYGARYLRAVESRLVVWLPVITHSRRNVFSPPFFLPTPTLKISLRPSNHLPRIDDAWFAIICLVHTSPSAVRELPRSTRLAVVPSDISGNRVVYDRRAKRRPRFSVG